MYISYKEISELAAKVIRTYRNLPQIKGKNIYRIDPVILAEQVLHLSVHTEKLSDDHSILGMTSFRPVSFCMYDSMGKVSRIIRFDGRSIYIDSSLFANEALSGRRNFTMMHECAHWILMMFYPAVYGKEDTVAARCVYARENRKRSSEEWLADALASELLMPVDAIEYVLYTYGFSGKIRIAFDTELPDKEEQLIHFMMKYLDVSKTALLQRLKRLGYTEEITPDAYWEETFTDDCIRICRRIEANDRMKKLDHIRSVVCAASGCKRLQSYF